MRAQKKQLSSYTEAWLALNTHAHIARRSRRATRGELNGITFCLKNNIYKANFYANVVPYTWMRV